MGVRLLGIDPGLGITGFSVLEKNNDSVLLRDCGYVVLKKSDSLPRRIGVFNAFFIEKIKQHTITALAIETPFLGKNTQSFLKLGYLRGVLYLLADQHNLTLHEYTPRQVKATVTGSGAATKEQVAFMMMKLFPRANVASLKEKLDITDALAVALCAVWCPVAKNHELAQVSGNAW